MTGLLAVGIVAFLGGALFAAAAQRRRSRRDVWEATATWARGLWRWIPSPIVFGLLLGVMSVELSIAVAVLVAVIGASVATSYGGDYLAEARAAADMSGWEFRAWVVGG